MTATTAPSATPTIPAPAGAPATAEVSQALGAAAAALAHPSESASALSDTLADAALEDVTNQLQEMQNDGTRQEGSPTLEDVVYLPSTDPGTVRLQACVDSSQVKVLDAEGNEINANVPAAERRSLTIFTFQNTDGAWRLAGQTFPDDPTC